MGRTRATIELAAILLFGCASFDGRGLVPGKSSAAEVEALMGPPAQRLALPDGGPAAALYFFFAGPPLGSRYVIPQGPDP